MSLATGPMMKSRSVDRDPKVHAGLPATTPVASQWERQADAAAGAQAQLVRTMGAGCGGCLVVSLAPWYVSREGISRFEGAGGEVEIAGSPWSSQASGGPGTDSRVCRGGTRFAGAGVREFDGVGCRRFDGGRSGRESFLSASVGHGTTSGISREKPGRSCVVRGDRHEGRRVPLCQHMSQRFERGNVGADNGASPRALLAERRPILGPRRGTRQPRERHRSGQHRGLRQRPPVLADRSRQSRGSRCAAATYGAERYAG